MQLKQEIAENTDEDKEIPVVLEVTEKNITNVLALTEERLQGFADNDPNRKHTMTSIRTLSCTK